MRILVTGSRDWDDVVTLEEAILVARAPGSVTTIVHGGCPTGADRLADDMAVSYGFTREVHPAKWSLNGKAAGFIRNREMVDLGAAVCVAFIKNGSRGASHTARLAEEAGIPTRRYTA